MALFFTKLIKLEIFVLSFGSLSSFRVYLTCYFASEYITNIMFFFSKTSSELC